MLSGNVSIVELAAGSTAAGASNESQFPTQYRDAGRTLFARPKRQTFMKVIAG
jgi:hypothetical protein